MRKTKSTIEQIPEETKDFIKVTGFYLAFVGVLSLVFYAIDKD